MKSNPDDRSTEGRAGEGSLRVIENSENVVQASFSPDKVEIRKS